MASNNIFRLSLFIEVHNTLFYNFNDISTITVNRPLPQGASFYFLLPTLYFLLFLFHFLSGLDLLKNTSPLSSDGINNQILSMLLLQ